MVVEGSGGRGCGGRGPAGDVSLMWMTSLLGNCRERTGQDLYVVESR